MSFVFCSRVEPVNSRSSPGRGAVPPQLAPLLHNPLAPPPLHVDKAASATGAKMRANSRRIAANQTRSPCGFLRVVRPDEGTQWDANEGTRCSFFIVFGNFPGDRKRWCGSRLGLGAGNFYSLGLLAT